MLFVSGCRQNDTRLKTCSAYKLQGDAQRKASVLQCTTCHFFKAIVQHKKMIILSSFKGVVLDPNDLQKQV